jgi:pre-mRNA-processing factor 19
VGGQDGEIKIFTVTTGENAVNIPTAGPLSALSFSENGIWFASASSKSQSVSVWDLRKPQAAIISFEIGSAVNSVAWDYTGQFLAVAAAGCVAVMQYEKKGKSWSEPLRKGLVAVDVAWGSSANSLTVLNEEGALVTLT